MCVFERSRILEKANTDGQIFVVYRGAGREDEERVDEREAADCVTPFSERPGHC